MHVFTVFLIICSFNSPTRDYSSSTLVWQGFNFFIFVLVVGKQLHSNIFFTKSTHAKALGPFCQFILSQAKNADMKIKIFLTRVDKFVYCKGWTSKTNFL
jgi:hypothetical protein